MVEVKKDWTIEKKLVVIRGGGDLATGVACRLYQAGFKVIILETGKPTAIRRTVSFAQSVFTGATEIEGIRAVLAESPEAALQQANRRLVPVLIDPDAEYIAKIRPFTLVDAIIAKRNCVTDKNMAPIVIGVGPGFVAGNDVDAVVETKRGHYLGRVYYEGEALANTGVPGEIAGADKQRIVRAPQNGIFEAARQIGDWVEEGEVLGIVSGMQVSAPLTGVLRGLINQGVRVNEGMKIGDVDPREVDEYCWSVSDKARAVGGGILEAILYVARMKHKLEVFG